MNLLTNHLLEGLLPEEVLANAIEDVLGKKSENNDLILLDELKLCLNQWMFKFNLQIELM